MAKKLWLNSQHRARDLRLLQSIMTRSGAHTAFYSVGTKGALPGNTAPRAWSWTLTSF